MADSPSWQEQQEASVQRYLSEAYNRDDTIPRLFGGFMAVTLDRDAAVLDVGCGISPDLPPYVRELGLKHYTGLEPLAAPARRFPCLQAVAENIPLAADSLDAVIFATSMDHIEDIDGAMREVKRVLRSGGRIYMWIGLYEPEMLARAKTLGNVLKSKGWKRAARLLLPQVEYGMTLWRMWDRHRRLETGKPIDTHHCRYYTRDRVEASLRRWGLKEERSLLVPAYPSLFVEARVC